MPISNNSEGIDLDRYDLLDLVEEGNIEAALELYHAGDFGAVTTAAISGHLDVLSALLDVGLDVNARDQDGCTALIAAAAMDDDAPIRFLISRGADVNAEAPGSVTALVEAAAADSVKIIQVLLDAGADLHSQGWYAAARAISSYHYRSMDMMLRAGVDVNACDEHGNSLLSIAAFAGRISTVDDLLKRGATANSANRSGHSVLMYGAQSRVPQVVQLLIDHGADVAAKRKDGFTALRLARDRGDQGIVQILAQAGAVE